MITFWYLLSLSCALFGSYLLRVFYRIRVSQEICFDYFSLV